MKNLLLLLTLLVQLSLIAQLPGTFIPEDQPKAPDYSLESAWIALPFHKDLGDKAPKNEPKISDSLKQVDVFYIYPTIYSGGKTWCADISNKKLNRRIAHIPLSFQVTAFNHVGRIYAPLYRQANNRAFIDSAVGEIALDFAYLDVKNAFEYYMKHYNNGRPVILVSHSQGTRHARQLLQDYFDKPAMKAKLVCAYLVGYGIYPDKYKVLTPCQTPAETNCYLTWSSFKDGYTPEPGHKLVGQSCINPISWKADTLPAAAKVGILLNTTKKKPFYSIARVTGNHLAVTTKMPLVRKWPVMHLVDFNLFWYSIRQNASERVAAYLAKEKSVNR